MQFARHGHSISAIKDRFLVVTGSRVEQGQASSSVEFYNIEMNTWFTQPSLNNGRYYHSSCVFNGKWVYVFAGIDVHSKRYFNSIERLDTSYNTDQPGKWEAIQELAPQFTIRQGQCSHQINKNEIVVFGGFGGDFLDDVFTFNHSEGTMKREE